MLPYSIRAVIARYYDQITNPRENLRQSMTDLVTVNPAFRVAVERDPFDMGDVLDAHLAAEGAVLAGLEAITPEPRFPGLVMEDGSPHAFQAVRMAGKLFVRFVPPHEASAYLVMIDEREVIDL